MENSILIEGVVLLERGVCWKVKFVERNGRVNEYDDADREMTVVSMLDYLYLDSSPLSALPGAVDIARRHE